jgi:2-isopropylmalate synthase
VTDVLIYDTTLRDGTQGEGFQLSVREKLAVAELLDELGVAHIEGGWPGSNPRDEAFFREARALRLQRARLTAFGATRRAKMSCDADPSIQALLASETPTVTVFGKTWTFHATHALGITPEQNLEIIADTVAYLRSRCDEVIFDAEHFFDGWADDADYALAALRAAADAGAHWVVLCDTNGGTLTRVISEVVARVARELPCPIGIHTHNDAELAVANSLAAVDAGATMVQGTINGHGERCGNANLISIIPGLELKMGRRCLPEGGLRTLTHVSRALDEITNQVPWTGRPYVGASAFAHKGGVHVSAVLKDARTYEHITPETVGNERRILISDLSGRANIDAKLAQHGLDANADEAGARAILARVKDLEAKGYQFEGAEASFRLLVDEALGRRKHHFDLDDLDVTVSLNGAAGTPATAVARLRVRVDGDVREGAAIGNGPVDALDHALRALVQKAYPVLEGVRLVDYKVRILASSEGTEAVVRVLIQSTDGHDYWGTVGVSTNIIEASWLALADSFEYKLLLAETEETT